MNRGNICSKMFLKNCCAVQAAPLFHIPPLSSTRPMTMKKNWLESEVKSRKRYVLQLNLAQRWKGGSVTEEISSHWNLLHYSSVLTVSLLFGAQPLRLLDITLHHFILLTLFSLRLFPPLCHQFCIISELLHCHHPAWWPQASGSPY